MTKILYQKLPLANKLALILAVAVAVAAMFDESATVRTKWSVSALVLPRQSPAAVHRTGTAQQTTGTTSPFYKSNSKAFKSTTAFWIECTKQPLLLRQPSAIQLGPGNNNMPSGGGGGGSSDMDPGLKLLVCILIDFVGVASFAAPGLGEATDVGWAPISAFLVNYLFGNGLFTALAFVEEIAPGLDFIPTATLAWFFENANKESSAGDTQPPPSTAPPPSQPPSQYPPYTRKNSKSVESDVIDVDIID